MLKSSPKRAKAVSPPPAPVRAGADLLVVGIGASAGGLDACRQLVELLPADNGMAFILVQHLDPTHESMMVDLLAGHTSMKVCQATEGMPIERDHFYVIPPGAYLAVGNGALHLSHPRARHGARLPFDFLLHSLAAECGPTAVCVVLSGTGADGSAGLRAVKDGGGLVIAQDPDEAEYEGMPRSAIETGAVDVVLAAAKIPEALVKHSRGTAVARTREAPVTRHKAPSGLLPVVELLRTKTAHDFTLYKPGTLQRRIERRMGMAAIKAEDKGRYLEILNSDAGELDLLAKDLLINVTSFFRDTKVFEFLAATIVPDLVRRQTPDQPLRIWIAGCSTGEETYSLAMLFHEEIAAAKRNLKLQVFASDVDPDAVASARDGLYPETIGTVVSPARLARFFSQEGDGYRVSPELRATVVFAVQDVLADPPFSRLDLVSCRNLLIYLRPEAQARVVSLFHFALRQGGILLLGSAETPGGVEGRFEVVSKAQRVYRHIGRSRPGDVGFLADASDGARIPAPARQARAPLRQADLGDLGRRLLLETYAPAAILINHRHECLFFFGPTDRYVRVAPGRPAYDLLAMVRPGMRTRVRSAIQRAIQENARITVGGGRLVHEGHAPSFGIDVQPIANAGEALLLVCFVEAKQEQTPRRPAARGSQPRVAELERELDTTRTELRGAIHDLEMSSEEQNAVNEEASSVNEEYQSANEELLTSKEELQSLNEELTALNGQLQETLERQRTTADDLQNILYSTDVATLFLDTSLNIRFFTPTTKSLFNVIPSDVGRPLAGFSSLVEDSALLTDAGAVLRTMEPVEREVEAQHGAWYTRRVFPYRARDGRLGGVVITFANITERRRAAGALEAANRQAQQANVAKSRFLAAASHDLRQPLQAISLMRGVLAKRIREGKTDEALELVERLGDTADAMTSMLNTLLDINQIEVGTVHVEIADFPINDLLGPLQEEFAYQAQAKGLGLRAVACGALIRTDPRLLEQMLRNLLSNALKYTRHGKVLLGCRRHGGKLSVEVLDTGVGIPKEELQTIFEEFHQLDSALGDRNLGLGLGLAIVQRLGELLGHRVRVASRLGKGSVFSIDVPLAPRAPALKPASHRQHSGDGGTVRAARRTGTILVVEDDPEVRKLLELILTEEGHHTFTAPDGAAALELIGRGGLRPDLILSDHNLPNGLSGLQLAAKLRREFHRETPVIILTGDISTGTLRDIGLLDCVHLYKPVQSTDLIHAIQRLLSIPQSTAHSHAPHRAAAAGSEIPVIFVVDDDSHVRDGIRALLEDDGRTVEAYASCEAFLETYHPGRGECLLIDAYLPGMSGLELLQRLHDAGDPLPAIMITGNSDVPTAVRAMKTGASDFIEKPIGPGELLASVERAVDQSRDSSKLFASRETAARAIAGLTLRQRQILELVLAGQPSKNIAADLGISQRTVESHRASIMKKTGLRSLPALARLALAAAWNGAAQPLEPSSTAAPAPASP